MQLSKYKPTSQLEMHSEVAMQKAYYLFIHSVVNIAAEFTKSEKKTIAEVMEYWFTQVIQTASERKIEKKLNYNAPFHTQYLQLLAKFDPEHVARYISQQKDAELEIDECLSICKNNAEATARLYERKGDPESSILTIIDSFEGEVKLLKLALHEIHASCIKYPSQTSINVADKWNKYNLGDYVEDAKLEPLPKFTAIRTMQNTFEYRFVPSYATLSTMESITSNFDFDKYIDPLDIEEAKRLRSQLQIAVHMCSYNSGKKIIDKKVIEGLWFKIMDVFVTQQRCLRHGLRGSQLETQSKAANTEKLDNLKKKLDAIKKNIVDQLAIKEKLEQTTGSQNAEILLKMQKVILIDYY